jgi:hypothetical protein
VAVSEPPGDFDYLWEDLGEADEDFGYDDEDFGNDEYDEYDGYDGYDVDPYEVAPAPWYRTRGALLAIGAIGIALVAILVSAVLLVSRHSRGPARTVETTIAPTPSSVSVTTPPMIATVPPSPPPSSTETTTQAPVVVAPPQRTSQPPKPTDVTVIPTPVTRSPISVRPEPRTPTRVQEGPYPGFPHF